MIVNTVGWFVIGNSKNVKVDSVLHGNIKYEKLLIESSFPNIKNRKDHIKKNLSDWMTNVMKLFWMLYMKGNI